MEPFNLAMVDFYKIYKVSKNNLNLNWYKIIKIKLYLLLLISKNMLEVRTRQLRTSAVNLVKIMLKIN